MLYYVHFFNFVLFTSSSKEGDAWGNCLYTKGILYAKVCTRLNHLGAKILKSPYRGRGANPPPPPLGRYAPSGLVASLPRKVAIFLGIFYLKCWEVCILYQLQQLWSQVPGTHHINVSLKVIQQGQRSFEIQMVQFSCNYKKCQIT